jgi:acetyltransferase-like isoleucine patch superfamily enzyme
LKRNEVFGAMYTTKKFLLEMRYQLRFALPIWFTILLTAWFPDCGPSVKIRGYLLSVWLPGRPRRLAIGRDVTLLSANRLNLGKNVYLAKGAWINALGGVTIADEVACGPYVVISSTSHGFHEGSVQRGGAHPKPISVGKGTWLAAHAVVAAGTSVGAGNLVAANSVVIRSSPPNVKLGGVPAKIIGPRTDNPASIHSKHDFVGDDK